MVQAGRVVCITAPFLLSVAALVTLVLVFVAGTMEKNKTTGDLYFVNVSLPFPIHLHPHPLTSFPLQINLQNLTITSSSLPNGLIPAGTDTSTLGTALEAAKQALGVKDHYTIYLRNYCAWDDNEPPYSHCSDPAPYFWFNPLKVWNLDLVQSALPQELRAGLDAYKAGSKAMFVLYAAALAANGFTILVGFTAIFSRWGSFFTTFFAAAQAVAYLGASIVASAMFAILRKALDHELEDDFGVKSNVGSRTLAMTWIGTAFAVGAGFFWFLSVCCCSGRSPYNNKDKKDRGRGKMRAEKTPYTYERVGSPYMGPHGGQNVPLAPYGGGQNNHGPRQTGHAYEPFRSHA